MKCINEIYAQHYIDGELSTEVTIELEKHLDECLVCAKLVSEQEMQANTIVDSINQFVSKKVIIPPFNKPQVEIPQRKKRGPLYINIATIAAAIVLIFLMFPVKKEASQEIGFVQHITEEIDANKPITEQEITIIVIDPLGNREELTIN